MTEADVEIILQRAHEAFPQARPRIISIMARKLCPRVQGIYPARRDDSRAHLRRLFRRQRHNSNAVTSQ